MVLKLYGSALSTCTRRAAVVFHEKNAPFEFHPIDMSKGEHKSPEYMEKQPFGQVPYLDDDGFILYESRAIGFYIARKYGDQGTPLIPTSDLKAEALLHQAVSVEMMDFNDSAEKAVLEMVIKPMKGQQGDKATFEKLIATLSSKLDVYDKILSKQKYLAGNEITLADLFHLPYGHMLPRTGANVMESRPNVKRWFDDISSRPAWQAVKGGVKSTA